MAFMGCYTREQRLLIEARAREILRKDVRKRAPCNCYNPQDTGGAHAPDCSSVLASDAAWDYAVERAADELGF